MTRQPDASRNDATTSPIVGAVAVPSLVVVGSLLCVRSTLQVLAIEDLLPFDGLGRVVCHHRHEGITVLPRVAIACSSESRTMDDELQLAYVVAVVA